MCKHPTMVLSSHISQELYLPPTHRLMPILHVDLQGDVLGEVPDGDAVMVVGGDELATTWLTLD